MELATLKPILTALVMPPTSPLLLVLLGLLLWRKRILAFLCVGFGFLSLWIMSSHGFAVMLSRTALPQVPHIELPDVKGLFKERGVQAIVVLGGGVESRSREYEGAQLKPSSVARLQYGMLLSKTANLPLAFSGGVGWSAMTGSDTEAAAAARWLAQSGWPALRWQDANSRDTLENAGNISQILKKDGVKSIALVTHAWHMPRAMQAFEGTGLQVTAAPTAYVEPAYSFVLEWLPSAEGLSDSRRVIRELLGLAIMGSATAQDSAEP
jgi:uncharacterized SAM-binding protein YcdF (DUF218 family)